MRSRAQPLRERRFDPLRVVVLRRDLPSAPLRVEDGAAPRFVFTMRRRALLQRFVENQIAQAVTSARRVQLLKKEFADDCRRLLRQVFLRFVAFVGRRR